MSLFQGCPAAVTDTATERWALLSGDFVLVDDLHARTYLDGYVAVSTLLRTEPVDPDRKLDAGVAVGERFHAPNTGGISRPRTSCWRARTRRRMRRRQPSLRPGCSPWGCAWNGSASIRPQTANRESQRMQGGGLEPPSRTTVYANTVAQILVETSPHGHRRGVGPRAYVRARARRRRRAQPRLMTPSRACEAIRRRRPGETRSTAGPEPK